MSHDCNPQLEDGHTRMANEWLEALLASRYPGRLKDFVLSVARETWGWGTTWREISIARLCALLDVRESRVYELRDDALRHNLIDARFSETSNGPALYRVQKRYMDWIDYLPSERARQKAVALKGSPGRPVDPSTGGPGDPSLGRTGDRCVGRHGDPSPGCHGDPCIGSKESLKENLKEREGAQVAPLPPADGSLPTARELRLQERAQLLQARDELLTPLPAADRELIVAFLQNAADENGSGRITLGREVSEIRALVGLRDEIGASQWAYGMFQANGARAPNLNYVKKAAANYRPGQTRGPQSTTTPSHISEFGSGRV